MISLPDDLLARIDRRAHEGGTTRSGLIQQLARDHLDTAADDRSRRLDGLLARPGRHGGQATAAVRDARRSR